MQQEWICNQSAWAGLCFCGPLAQVLQLCIPESCAVLCFHSILHSVVTDKLAFVKIAYLRHGMDTTGMYKYADI